MFLLYSFVTVRVVCVVATLVLSHRQFVVWGMDFSREEPHKKQVLPLPCRHLVYAKYRLKPCRLSLVAFRLSTHVRVVPIAVRSDLENRVFMRTCPISSFVGRKKRKQTLFCRFSLHDSPSANDGSF